jgi:Methyltransferase FkbM domain
MIPSKALPDDLLGRFREVISDPLNLLIERVPMVGVVEANHVYLHNGNRVPLMGTGSYYGPFSQLLVISRGPRTARGACLSTIAQIPGRSAGHARTRGLLGPLFGVAQKGEAGFHRDSRQAGRGQHGGGRRQFKTNGLTGEFIRSSVGRDHLQVDSFRSERRLDRLDILHVDIPGNEIEMLEGCGRTLVERRVDYLFISTHSQAIHAQVVTEMARFGYRVELSGDFDHETPSHDDLVFASSPDAVQIFKDFKPIGRTQILQSRPADVLKALSRVE